jgi:Domain of unknown function (DUF5658)
MPTIPLLWQYSYLQLLDFLSTLAFLALGLQEGNPVVKLAIDISPNPLLGLGAIKVAALALGVYCVKRGKFMLLSRINIAFAVVVAWNLVALIMGVLYGA